MSGLSSVADLVQLRPPTLRSICPVGPLKCTDSAARGQIAFKFHKIVLRRSRNAVKLSITLRVESEMADSAQIFNIPTPISLERLKLETSNLVFAPLKLRRYGAIQICLLLLLLSTTRSNFDGMQKTRLGQRERDPV